jgi:hypothetical protein
MMQLDGGLLDLQVYQELDYSHVRVAHQTLRAPEATEIESMWEVVPLGACICVGGAKSPTISHIRVYHMIGILGSFESSRWFY